MKERKPFFGYQNKSTLTMSIPKKNKVPLYCTYVDENGDVCGKPASKKHYNIYGIMLCKDCIKRINKNSKYSEEVLDFSDDIDLQTTNIENRKIGFSKSEMVDTFEDNDSKYNTEIEEVLSELPAPPVRKNIGKPIIGDSVEDKYLELIDFRKKTVERQLEKYGSESRINNANLYMEEIYNVFVKRKKKLDDFDFLNIILAINVLNLCNVISPATMLRGVELASASDYNILSKMLNTIAISDDFVDDFNYLIRNCPFIDKTPCYLENENGEVFVYYNIVPEFDYEYATAIRRAYSKISGISKIFTKFSDLYREEIISPLRSEFSRNGENIKNIR